MQEALLVVILAVVICIALIVLFGKPKQGMKSNPDISQIIQALKTISENQGVLSEQIAAMRAPQVNQSPSSGIPAVDPELLLRQQMMAPPETPKTRNIEPPNKGKRLADARAAKRAAQKQAPAEEAAQ